MCFLITGVKLLLDYHEHSKQHELKLKLLQQFLKSSHGRLERWLAPILTTLPEDTVWFPAPI